MVADSHAPSDRDRPSFLLGKINLRRSDSDRKNKFAHFTRTFLFHSLDRRHEYY